MNLTDSASFFIVYPVGLEDLGLLEIKEKFSRHFKNESFQLTKQVPGGLEIECPLHIGLSLNTVLRTPTRILLRLSEFKCRDAPKLYQKISKFNWAPWMIGQTPEIEASSTNSRLFDSRKIEKAIQDGVQQFYRHKPVKKKYLDHLQKINPALLPKIYFRAVDDNCTISLDTTGERLHLRGQKVLTGLAPIRENLASLLLLELQAHLGAKDVTLIDPMCGSGTFLIEASDANAVTTQREFSYQHIPIFLDNIKMMPLLLSGSQEHYKNILGYEINPEVVELAKKNCSSKSVTIERADLFASKTYSIDNSVIIMNPPYGIRVGEKSEINLTYYLKIIEAAKKNFTPGILGIIVPADYKLKSNQSFKIQSARAFKNGGIEVVFYVLAFI